MMTYRPLRLPAGAELRRDLEAMCTDNRAVSAFVIAGIGSLKNPRIRFAGAEDDTRLSGSFEILSLCGTLSADGAHLHMTVSDEHGRVVGGHVCYGNEVRTTAEILLALTPDWRLSRAFDPSTGYRELSVRAVDDEAKDPAERTFHVSNVVDAILSRRAGRVRLRKLWST